MTSHVEALTANGYVYDNASYLVVETQDRFISVDYDADECEYLVAEFFKASGSFGGAPLTTGSLTDCLEFVASNF